MQTKKRSTHVTNRRGVQVAELARKNNVSRKKWDDFWNNEEKVKEFFSQFRLRSLKNLESKKIISIPEMSFKRDDFLVQGFNGIIKLWLSPNILKIFKPLLSENIDFKGIDLEKFKLKKSLNDHDIQKEIKSQVQKSDDLVAEIKYLTSKQPKGEKVGDLNVPCFLF